MPFGTVMKKPFFVVILLIFAGIFLRLPPFLFSRDIGCLAVLSALHPNPGYQTIGFDEGLYGEYVTALSQTGLTSYPALAEGYVETQARLSGAVVPPTRFLYIFFGYLWHSVTGLEAVESLTSVSSLFSILLLVVSTIFAFRAGGIRLGVAVCALMAFAPTQLHMSQHGLIDGFFAFWAVTCLWLLWENLCRPNDWRLLLGLGLCLALLVLTKENAFFAYVGLCAVVAVCFWQKYGQITRMLLATMIVGPLLGVAILVNLCGTLPTTIHVYQLLVSKASVLPYAIATGDGPWYRYLIDLLIVSPIVLILALGAIFMIRKTDKAPIYFVTFIAASYVVMTNVRYGMNLRYTNMWDMPLRYLAGFCLTNVADRFGRATRWIFPAAVGLLCLFDWNQYLVFFVRHNLYELVTLALLKAISVVK
jgi:4-amino-4-deoxy-L-arabinose transferase-like glycosyltransferase